MRRHSSESGSKPLGQSGGTHMRRHSSDSGSKPLGQKVNQRGVPAGPGLKSWVVSYFNACQSHEPSLRGLTRWLEKYANVDDLILSKGSQKTTLHRPETLEETPSGRGLITFMKMRKDGQPDLKVLIRRYFAQFGETVSGL